MLRRIPAWAVLLSALVLPAPLAARRAQLTVLATTDLHGNLYPIDYATAQLAPRGLAKVATVISAERKRNPAALLIDCGDTIQGSPLEYVYQTWVRTGRLPLGLEFAGEPLRHDPMMLAMNHLGYDAMVLGNHEFNYGLKNLRGARAEAQFPWLSANTRLRGGDSRDAFKPYLVKTIDGVRIAVIGITTPAVPMWEKPENLGNYKFIPPREAVEQAVAELRALGPSRRPDVIVVAAHAGLGRAPKPGELPESSGENTLYSVALGAPGIDAIIFGHTHQELEQQLINGVLVTQPKNWGMSLARADFTLDNASGAWRVVEKKSRLLKVTEDTPSDEGVLRIAEPYHRLTERYLNTGVATATEPLDAALGRVEDSALLDLIQQVQLLNAKADVSFTSLFNSRVKIPKGPVTVRQIAALYLYDNELYAIEGNGRMVKDALENAARYFLSCHGEGCSNGPLKNPAVLDFNYDVAEGVEYQIDLTQPEGSRIRGLKFRGRPLEPDQKLRLAVNSYRAGGSAGYTMFRDAKVVWHSGEDIRQMIIDYCTEHKTLPTTANGNWRIEPPEARRTLQRQAQTDAARPQVQ